MAQAFFGGVHPHDMKAATNEKAIEQLAPPAVVVIPMSMHFGAPCTPLVKAGDHVKVGQKIGEFHGLGAPIHASVSGTVKAVEPRPYSMGGNITSVVIENDMQDEVSEEVQVPADPNALSVEEMVEIVKNAGIVGMGGATFPTHVKITSGIGKVNTVIINGAECEPYITADDALLCSYPEQIFRGLAALDAALHPDRRVIAVEDNKSEAIAILRRHLPDWPGVELAVLPTRYPQGAEKQLIQAVTGRQVPPGHLPFSVGCAVFNAGTVAAVYRAVYEGKPVTKRIVTVTGEGVKEPKNLIVRIGTPFAQVIEAAGGLTEDACKVLSGGPMMGTAQGELAAPVLKGTNAVLCLTSANPTPERPVCIRCSKCVEVCPMHLQPLYLYRYEAAGNLDALQALHVTDCIECGCCQFTCPADIPLLDFIRMGKQEVGALIRARAAAHATKK